MEQPEDYGSKPPLPDESPVSTQPPATPPTQPKSRKKLAIVLGILAATLLIAAAGAFWIYAGQSDDTAPEKPTASSEPETTGTGDKAIDQATASLTDSTADESNLMSDNDEAKVNDANQSAQSIGDAVNENNL